jgi:hypothetical protein
VARKGGSGRQRLEPKNVVAGMVRKTDSLSFVMKKISWQTARLPAYFVRAEYKVSESNRKILLYGASGVKFDEEDGGGKRDFMKASK